MTDELAVFDRIGSSSLTKERFVSFSLRLGKPSRLEYTARGFLHEKKHAKPELFAKKIELLLGVDSNYSYEMNGHIEYPDDFKGSRCQFIVNPLAGSDYIEYACDGLIGDGWCENRQFLFRLYVAPEIARNIIERRLLAEKLEQNFGEDDLEDIEKYDRPAWIRVRVDAVNYRCIHPDDLAKGKVWYSLSHLYC